MRILPVLPLIVFSFLFFTPSASYAEFFKWVDEDNVIHVVDSIHKVPERYRDSLSEEPPPSRVDTRQEYRSRPVKSVSPTRSISRESYTGSAGEETYGGKLLSWWRDAFSSTREKIDELKGMIGDKENYLSIYERGRRLGQVYDKTDISSYNKYKSDLPKDKKELVQLEKELKSLLRKAKNAGVPRSVRGR